ncbi:GNAT family N-acetyltransferase [Cellulophaga sp. Z1A5H]|uniref:GNAT family N-acetyltransferase n=1 Tax=Cellulophaga sp. Z1A5H TaxID=2687291 RepID=UPI0013FE12E2|nr:GNAT family N-acetyltransferase [Cellulophaga sp. Z1A5H]
MVIRNAKEEDAKEIVEHMMLAMDDIVYEFIGEDSKEGATDFLKHLVRKKNTQYSYENCWVAENEDGIIAVANVYDGGKLVELRAPVAEVVKLMFDKDFNPEDETQEGEFYIDTVGVHPDHQGKGVGSKVFRFLIDEYVHKRNETLGLLVDKDNPNAKKLYLKLGFEIKGNMTLTGKNMEHLQFERKKKE